MNAVEQMFEDLDYPMDVIWLDIEHTDGKRYFTVSSVRASCFILRCTVVGETNMRSYARLITLFDVSNHLICIYYHLLTDLVG